MASEGYADPTSVVGTGTIQIAVGKSSPATITLNTSNSTLTDLKNAINAANAGVTASVISDGSSSNPYRLLLSANATGAENVIAITSNLTGGTAPNFSASTFDQVENVGAPQGTSVKSLGSLATYTGAQNKTYTFTVGGSGTQTVGSGPITVNWTDGTNSGSISVTTAGVEVALTGTGSEGLTLAFAAGTLVAGDQFRVQTFSPLLQKAADARVSLGSTAGGGSPIVISSASNQIDNLIGGVSLKLKSVTTAPVTITATLDQEAIKASITGVLDKYNEVMRAIDKQFSYNSETKEAGALLGDQFLLAIQQGLRDPLSGAIDGLPK
ncbi:MAG TPA: flagellar filament capping protein FliD, partial [Anaerolineae bacterium]